ncbi:hypothetical protein TMEN_435, partial [Trichophyton mentagrophytes]
QLPAHLFGPWAAAHPFAYRFGPPIRKSSKD